MRHTTHSLEYRIAQVQRELASAYERFPTADEELAGKLRKEIVLNEAVLRLLKRTERLLRILDQ